VGLESALLSLTVCLSLLENQTGLRCVSGTGVCLSVHTLNLLLWSLAQFHSGQPAPFQMLPRHGWD